MPINITTIGLPWASLKIGNRTIAFRKDGAKTELPLLDLRLTADPENSEPGWLKIADGQRVWKPFKHGQPTPKSPGIDYKLTVALFVSDPVLGPEVLTLNDTSWAYRCFVEHLYNATEK